MPRTKRRGRDAGEIRRTTFKRQTSLTSEPNGIPSSTSLLIASPSTGSSRFLLDRGSGDAPKCLQIKSAAPSHRRGVLARSGSIDKTSSAKKTSNAHNIENTVLEAIGHGKVQLRRSPQEKAKFPDRVCLDRRGLCSIPVMSHETELRLLSLQHNLITSLKGLNNVDLSKLIFLDLYNNQIERICSVDRLVNVKVLLMGKNRLKKIEGLENATKLEVLDLHGNKIAAISNLSTLQNLKLLNLAGNHLKSIEKSDLEGLCNLKELNVKKNKLQKVKGFECTPRLEKLYLSNNELQSLESLESVAGAQSLMEITLDGNPVAQDGGDSIPFLVAHLPHLVMISSMPVTTQVREAAEASTNNSKNCTTATCDSDRRDKVIQNARANWELLRTDFKELTTKIAKENDSEGKPTAMVEPKDRYSVKQARPLTSVKKSYGLLNELNTAPLPMREKRVNFFERTASQDTASSHSTSTSSEMVKLPPILLPIINSLENVKINDLTLTSDISSSKRWGSSSSLEPGAHSSTSLTSDSESEVDVKPNVKKRVNFTMARSNTISEISTVPKSSTKEELSRTGARENEPVRHMRRANSFIGKPSKQPRSIRSAAVNGSREGAKSAIPMKGSIRCVRKDDVSPAKGVSNLTGAIEIADGCVRICGTDGAKKIDTPQMIADDINSALFQFMPFNSLAHAVPKLKNRLPNVTHITLRSAGLQFLGQINVLAELRNLRSLTVMEEGNPIVTKNWREYAVYRLAHWGLKEICGIEISKVEIEAANETYAGLGEIALRVLPEEPLAPLIAKLGKNDNAKASSSWIQNADPALKSVVAKEALQWKKGHLTQEDQNWRTKGVAHLTSIIDRAIDTSLSLRILDREWDDIFVETIEAALHDFVDIKTHVQQWNASHELAEIT